MLAVNIARWKLDSPDHISVTDSLRQRSDPADDNIPLNASSLITDIGLKTFENDQFFSLRAL